MCQIVLLLYCLQERKQPTDADERKNSEQGMVDFMLSKMCDRLPKPIILLGFSLFCPFKIISLEMQIIFSALPFLKKYPNNLKHSVILITFINKYLIK